MNGREDDRGLVVIHEAPNGVAAEMLKSFLEAEGIPAVVMGDWSGVWGDWRAVYTVHVAVPARYADEAKQVIAACIEEAGDIGS